MDTSNKVEEFVTCLDDLPDEMIDHIFSFLKQPEIPSVAQVCERWAAILKGPFLHWRCRLVELKYLYYESAAQLNLLSVQRLKCEIHGYTASHLTGLTGLRYLKATAHSTISPLVIRLLNCMKSLRTLDLFDCSIPCDALRSIVTLSNLKSLHLNMSNDLTNMAPPSQYPLKNIPDEIPQLTSLVRLQMMSHNLQNLPGEISRLVSLKWLSLRHNVLTSLNELGCCTTLRHLDLSHNGLSYLSAGLSQLVSLTKLVLDNNKLTNLPHFLASFPSLGALHVRSNQLQSLPSSFSQLTSLTSLGASHNQLNQLESVAVMTSLKHLMLDANYIKELPLSFSQLTSLQVFTMQGNLLNCIPAFFCTFHSLEHLNLSYNRIESVPSEFTCLTSLIHCDVNYNPLSADSVSILHQSKVIVYVPRTYV